MRFKKYLVGVLTRTYLHLKNLKFLFFVPLLIMNALIPMLNYAVYKQYGVGDRLYTNILEYSQWLMPFASVWWSLFALRDYLEGDGNELLYVNRHSNKFVDIFILFFISILDIAIVFSVYAIQIPQMKFEYIRILSICFLYFGIVYFVSFLTKSTTLSTLTVVLYMIVNIYYGRGDKRIPFIYVSTDRLSKQFFVSDYLPLLWTGLILTALGILINKKRIGLYRHA